MSDQARGEAPLKKVELHRHLEGSLRLESMVDVIRSFDLDLPSSPSQLKPYVQVIESDERTPENLLRKFQTIRHVFQDADVIRRLTFEVIEDAAAEGIAVLELRFTPMALVKVNSMTVADVIEVVSSAAREAAALHNVELGLIASMNRHESIEGAQEVVESVIASSQNGIQGLDLAGDESAVEIDKFVPLLGQAKQAGLRLTIHAGEWGGPENIAQAIERMGADRIGHGVRIMEDAGVMHLARTAGVGFEISPTSNLLTGVFDRYEDHPLSNMLDAGLRVAITTDDPAIFGTSLSREHDLVINEMGLSIETLKGLTLQAIQTSFFDEKTKRNLELDFTSEFWGFEG